MNTKKCVSCKDIKSVDMFSRNKNSQDGFKNYCKNCASEQNKRYRERHKEKVNERNREWYSKTKERKSERTQKEINKGFRVCSECGVKKDIYNYYERGNGGFYGKCKECHNKKVKIYVDANREKVLKRKRKYYIRTRDYQLSYFRKYNLENSQKNVERARKWAKDNPERNKELMSLAQNRRRSKLKKVENNFTRYDWEKCKDYFRNDTGFIECAYCNKKMKNATLEHFIPIDKGGNHTPNNILPICLNCNSKKSASDFYEWYVLMPFYSQENIIKINKYFNEINQNHGNHEPSL